MKAQCVEGIVRNGHGYAIKYSVTVAPYTYVDTHGCYVFKTRTFSKLL